MGNFKPCEIFTISLREARFAHFTREGITYYTSLNLGYEVFGKYYEFDKE